MSPAPKRRMRRKKRVRASTKWHTLERRDAEEIVELAFRAWELYRPAGAPPLLIVEDPKWFTLCLQFSGTMPPGPKIRVMPVKIWSGPKTDRKSRIVLRCEHLEDPRARVADFPIRHFSGLINFPLAQFGTLLLRWWRTWYQMYLLRQNTEEKREAAAAVARAFAQQVQQTYREVAEARGLDGDVTFGVATSMVSFTPTTKQGRLRDITCHVDTAEAKGDAQRRYAILIEGRMNRNLPDGELLRLAVLLEALRSHRP